MTFAEVKIGQKFLVYRWDGDYGRVSIMPERRKQFKQIYV